MSLKKTAAAAAAVILIAGIFAAVKMKGSLPEESISAADDIIAETYIVPEPENEVNDKTDIIEEASAPAESAPDDGASEDFIIKTGKDGLKYVYAYKGNGGDIRLPEEADGVLRNAFFDNADITGVTFPSGCKYLHAGAFQYCANLERVVFEGDASFGESSFGTCPSLETVTVEGSVMTIDKMAFYECTSLKTVKINGNEYDFEIGRSAFQECHSLESINIPDKCRYIGERAFLNCIGMTELYIPEYTRMIYKYRKKDYDIYNEPYNFGMFETYDYGESVMTHTAGPTHEYNKVNGRTYFSKDKYPGDDAEPFEYSENIVFITEELTPKEIILTVIDDSDAARYASIWGIDFQLYDGTADGKLAAPNSFMCSSRRTEFDIQWRPVTGADGYRVCIYREETDRYEKYMDVAEPFCTVSGLTANTDYMFRVTALVEADGEYIPQTPSFSADVKTTE